MIYNLIHIVKRSIKKSITVAFAVITVIFTFTPESLYESKDWVSQKTLDSIDFLSSFELKDINIIISRIGLFIALWVVILVLCVTWKLIYKKVTIQGNNYSISVEYGDIFKTKNVSV